MSSRNEKLISFFTAKKQIGKGQVQLLTTSACFDSFSISRVNKMLTVIDPVSKSLAVHTKIIVLGSNFVAAGNVGSVSTHDHALIDYSKVQIFA